jgi:hypothetical protein
VHRRAVNLNADTGEGLLAWRLALFAAAERAEEVVLWQRLHIDARQVVDSSTSVAADDISSLQAQSQATTSPVPGIWRDCRWMLVKPLSAQPISLAVVCSIHWYAEPTNASVR